MIKHKKKTLLIDFLRFRIPFLILSLTLLAVQANYNITYYDHNPGIHFEKLGELRLFNNKWKIITFINLDDFSSKLMQLKSYSSVTASLCNRANAQDKFYICTLFLKTNKHIFDKLKIEIDVLHELVGNNYVNRNKRGWFDIIGKASKVLFGILDEDDAKYYNAKISQFSKNEDSVLNLLKEQTRIVQSTLLNFNSTIGSLDYNENILKFNVKIIADELNKEKKDIDTLTTKTNLEEHITMLNTMVNQLQFEVMTLTNAFLIAKKGILHPAILTPVRLINELKKVFDSIPHGLEFPIPLDPSNANLLFNIIELQVYLENQRLIYIINIPLVETHIFYVYKISPFPKQITLNEFILIQPSSKYIALDKSKQQFITFSEFEYNRCLTILGDKFICRQTKPILLAHLVENCEIKLLQANNKIPQICDTRIIHSNTAFFIQLQTVNTWLFAVPRSETLTISCTNDTKPVDILLKDCGSVTIGKLCKAYSFSTMLVPHDNTYQSSVFSEFLPSFNIDEDCCEKVKKQGVNLTDIVLNEQYRTLIKHIPELNVASHKLEDIQNLADELKRKNIVNSYTHSASAIAYIIAFFLILFVLYKLYKKCCRKTSCCGMIPNVCIRVNQNVEPSSDKYVARYSRNIAQTASAPDEFSEDETISINPTFQQKSIRYLPSKRTSLRN